MRFHIDQDSGQSIVGWIVLDNPSQTPKVLVSSPSTSTLLIPANQIRPGLKDRGLHTTGMAGFRINEKNFPGISEAEEIEIRESESNIIVYKRSSPNRYLPRKLFILALGTLPQPQLEELFAQRFAVNFLSVDQHGGETLTSIIGNELNKSVYMSGSPLMIRYQPLLREWGFTIATVLRDPYEELAERILLCKNIKASPRKFTACPARLQPVFECLSKIDLDDESSIASVFRSLNTHQQDTLSNPNLRLLACDIDERPEQIHLSSALDNLAAMDLVGLRDRYADFKSILHEILQADILGEEQPYEIPSVQDTAAKLIQIREARDLLALDIELYTHAKNAIEAALK